MVETYLSPENEEIVVEIDKKEEWYSKIVELGMEGQVALTVNSGEKQVGSPYTFMNTSMKNVFEILCPTKCSVEKYNKTQVPLEVLSHIALCKQEGYFYKLEIWYDNRSPDPILVGHLSSSYSSPLHLICRWGDEVVPYEQLVEKAKNRFTKTYENFLKEAKAEIDMKLASIDSHIEKFLSGAASTYDLGIRTILNTTNTDSGLPF